MLATLNLLKPWLFYFLGRSLFYAAVIATLLTVSLYLYKGANTLDKESFLALQLFFKTFFVAALVVVSVPLFVTSIKPMHHRCVGGMAVVIMGCDKKALQEVSLDDAFKIARRWLAISMWILMMWILIVSVLYYALSASSDAFAWMSAALVYALFMLSVIMAFFLLLHRCKKVKIELC